MYSLELALFLMSLYNNWMNPYLTTYLICKMVSRCLTMMNKHKFTKQKQIEYCNFADKRCICGIRNFGDVISNLAFIGAGVYNSFTASINEVVIFNNSNIQLGLICILIGIGSTYFHWRPSLATLYWDRLPMIIGMAYIINYYTGLGFQDLLLDGLFTLEFHKVMPGNNLSLYVEFQMNMIIFLFWINGISWCLVLYILAKVFEDCDEYVYLMTNRCISGHTIKHLLAGLAMMMI